MPALDYLRRAGLAAEVIGDKLRLCPVERITDAVRQFVRAHKAELLAELNAANEAPIAPTPWLHLLVLADGRVIQRAGEQGNASVEQDARLRYGDNLLQVLPVSGVTRPLTETEIVKALAGTLVATASVSPPPPSDVWLARVARLLGICPAELLEGGHLEQHDLAELAGTDAALVAETIRRSPAWLNRPPRSEPSAERFIVGKDAEPQRIAHTAATASSEWIEARDQYHAHIFGCRACYALTGRFCAVGATLRQRYDCTPMERRDD